ncbi:hypothetical protein RRF57_009296 [Xylaria bambusicola]|uniref:Uncharacterized protein n=1 Tax=Xylaria bambusicola TaxID=326684 RepID=A0AAN7UQP8_9PEZI
MTFDLPFLGLKGSAWGSTSLTSSSKTVFWIRRFLLTAGGRSLKLTVVLMEFLRRLTSFTLTSASRRAPDISLSMALKAYAI